MTNIIYLNRWSQHLLTKFDQTSKLDIGYGKSGILLFFILQHLKKKNEAELQLCFDMMSSIIAHFKTSNSNTLGIELIEFTHLCRTYHRLFSNKFPINKILKQNELLIDIYQQELFRLERTDPYTGFFYSSYLKLYHSKSQKDHYIKEFLLKDFVRSDHSGSLFKSNSRYNITHGISFYLNYLILYTFKFGISNEINDILVFSKKHFQNNYKNISELKSCNLNMPYLTNFKLNLCYDDLGILSTWWNLCHLTKDEPGKSLVEDLLIQAHILGSSQNQDYDISLLYGTSGMVRFFNKMYQRTKNERFKIIRTYWQKRTEDSVAEVFKLENFGSVSLFEGLSGALIDSSKIVDHILIIN